MRVLLLALLWTPVFASEPGHPLDCDDWVLLENGLSCSDYVPYPCGYPSVEDRCKLGYSGTVSDNEGFFYRLETDFDVGDSCLGYQEDRLQLIRFDKSSETVVAYIQDRCHPSPDCLDRVRAEGADTTGTHGTPRPPALRFDPVAGRMFVSLTTGSPFCGFPDGRRVVALGGFAPLASVLPQPVPESQTVMLVAMSTLLLGGIALVLVLSRRFRHA